MGNYKQPKGGESVANFLEYKAIATFLGESGGIEPEFAISYTRRTVGLTDNNDHYYKVYCKAAKEYMELHPEITSEDQLPDYFVSSANIDPLDRVKTQGFIQKYIDTAISSTVNLPESATEEEMAGIYLAAWKCGLKGLTIFRNGCKRQAILTTDSKSDKVDTQEGQIQPEGLKRGDIIACTDDLIGKKRKINTGCGPTHILAYFDPDTADLVEVYLNKGSKGGCALYMTGLSRMISLACRAGVDILAIKDQLDSTGACPSYAVRSAVHHDTSPGSCCPMAIGNALISMWKEMKQEIGLDEQDSVEASTTPVSKAKEITRQPSTKPVSNDVQHDSNVRLCPECGEPLVAAGGCFQCNSCGYTKCE